jgi:carbon-monoxide dehydrogenase medium subunit
MIPAAFTYHRPKTLAAAVRLLQTLGPDARVLAGGQSLLPMMKLRLASPAHVVDLGRIASLRRIRKAGDGLLIGALATHWIVETSPAVRRLAPVLAETAAVIGDLQVRNLGTVGGSLAHADPAADYPATLLALDAVFAVEGGAASRTIAAADFFLGLMTTALGPGELLTEVRLPLPPARFGAAYLKMPNPASGFALAGVAAGVALDGDGLCATARVGITGVGAAAYRAHDGERAVIGQEPTDELLAAASARAADGVEANDDLHASADFRRHLARVLTRRALAAARDRALAKRRPAGGS